MELNALLFEYYKRFGSGFPLMQAPNIILAEEHVKKSLQRNTKVEKIYPDIYGAVRGKEI